MGTESDEHEWDHLIWLLYDRHFALLEPWEWPVHEYRSLFDSVKRLNPKHMRSGRALHAA